MKLFNNYQSQESPYISKSNYWNTKRRHR